VAFCNSCGATLDSSASFCTKCGGKVTGAVSPSPPTPPVAPAAGTPTTSSGLRTFLIVVGVVIALGILGTVAATLVGLHIAKRTHVSQKGDRVRVETPFGTVTSTKDPEEAARNLGLDIYPGARALKTDAASVVVGGMKTVSAEFQTSDSPDKVFAFYKQKFPDANVTQSDQQHYTIVSTNHGSILTINIEASGDETHFHIANVTGMQNRSITGAD
jgi:zinc-ribbon domain